MSDEESKVEFHHRGNAPTTRKKLALMDDESSVTLNAPSPVQNRPAQKSPGAVGFRQAVQSPDDLPGKTERRRNVKQSLREKRDEKRQGMWDKLDNARRSATERYKRYTSFEPFRAGEEKSEPEPPPRRRRSRRRR
ncbi:MAG: hypothetical protein AAF219_11295 [Myxococcota bacterium]